MALTINVIEVDDNHPFGNLLWHNAMVSVNINWHDSVSAVGEYFILSVYSEWAKMHYHISLFYCIIGETQFITDISSQENSFLVEGSRKHFVCEIYGITLMSFLTYFTQLCLLSQVPIDSMQTFGGGKDMARPCRV